MAIRTEQGNVKLLQDVQYVPSLAYNLLSVGQLILGGYTVLFDKKECCIKDQQTWHTLANIHMIKNRMFSLKVASADSLSMVVNNDKDSTKWHLRYGHLNIQGIKLLSQKRMVYGLPHIAKISFCESCLYGKQTRESFPSGQAWRALSTLELIHTDWCGPMQTESLGGNKFFLLFTDDFSRMSWVYFLKTKTQAFEFFKSFKALVEKQSGQNIMCLHIDRGGELI